jgi:ribosome modulation factor
MTARTPPATPDIARAERQGYASYINGRNPDIDGCPYPKGPLREAWLRGFRLSEASPHAVLHGPPFAEVA